MADHNCKSPLSSNNSASHAEEVESNTDKSKPISSSYESSVFSEKACLGETNITCNNQSSQSKIDAVPNDPSIKKSGDTNGVSDSCSNKLGSFLRPSALSGGSNLFLGGHSSDSPTPETQSTTKCPLKSPKLNLTPSRFGNVDSPVRTSPEPKLPFQQMKSPFTNSVLLDNDKNDTVPTRSNVLQTESNVSGEKQSKPFSSFTNPRPIGGTSSTKSPLFTTNFVFGQNLHERVVDGIATPNNSDKSDTEIASSNGMSDMLFTSVLTSKEIKENLSSESSSNTQEPFSLIEDAARCQEARANKRKYEEVLVTTGEEDEENILQVNVKLFAFDSGKWVERGRGLLRLNDKNCDGTVVSRIVIRTMGSLRVVLNTKIWSGMSLTKANERSIRLTAMDPNGQLKIFLIQASPKEMTALFHYLDIRLKRCQESLEEPEKKKAEKVLDEGDESEGNKT